MDEDQRKELHRRIMLLRGRAKAGKLVFIKGATDHLIDDLMSVRLADDGLVDPDSVSSAVRALGLAVAYEEDRREWKEAVSLREIQEAYFARVEGALGELYTMMEERSAEPHQIAAWFASYSENVTANVDVVEGVAQELEGFWADVGQAAFIHTEDLGGRTAVFGGELFPTPLAEDPASLVGLYMDTVVLPDPILKIKSILPHQSPQWRVKEIVRLGLQVLRYRELALADLEHPVVAVVPFRGSVEQEYKQQTMHWAEQRTLEHLQVLFGETIDSSEGWMEYLSALTTVESVIERLVRPDRLLFATEWPGDLAAHIERALAESILPEQLRFPGPLVWSQVVSRMGQAADVVRHSMGLRGVPLIQAPTSWLWFNWFLEHEGAASGLSANTNYYVCRALQSVASSKAEWLGAVPHEVLIAVRKEGALEELRETLGSGLDQLMMSGPADVTAAAETIVKNIEDAFKRHAQDVRELRWKNLKFAGRDLASLLVVGGIEVAAAATGSQILALGGIAAAMSGYVPSVKDLKEKSDALVKERNRLVRSPVGLLMRLAGE